MNVMDPNIGTATSGDKDYTFNTDFAKEMNALADRISELADNTDPQFDRDAAIYDVVGDFMQKAQNASRDYFGDNADDLNANSARYLTEINSFLKPILSNAITGDANTKSVEELMDGFAALTDQFLPPEPATVPGGGGSGSGPDLSEADDLLDEARDATDSETKAEKIDDALSAIIDELRGGGEGGGSDDGGSGTPPSGDGSSADTDEMISELKDAIDTLQDRVAELRDGGGEGEEGGGGADGEIDGVAADIAEIENQLEDLIRELQSLIAGQDEDGEGSGDAGSGESGGPGDGSGDADGDADPDQEGDPGVGGEVDTMPVPAPAPVTETTRYAGDELMGKVSGGGKAVTFDESDQGIGLKDDEIGRGEAMTFYAPERAESGSVEIVDLFADKGGKGQEMATIRVFDGDELVKEIPVRGDMDGNQTIDIDVPFDRLEFVADGVNGDKKSDFAIAAVSTETATEGGAPVETPGEVFPAVQVDFDISDIAQVLEAVRSATSLVDNSDIPEAEQNAILDDIIELSDQALGLAEASDGESGSTSFESLATLLDKVQDVFADISSEIGDSPEKDQALDDLIEGIDAISSALQS